MVYNRRRNDAWNGRCDIMQIMLNLDSEAGRPVVQISWFHGCRAILDTGALFPIWAASDELLIELGAKLIKKSQSRKNVLSETLKTQQNRAFRCLVKQCIITI